MKFSNSAFGGCAGGGCADVAPQLTALFDGEADDAQTQQARAHLLICPNCARLWLDWTRYRDTFQSEPAPVVPPTLLWRVLIAYRVTAFAHPARRRSRLPQIPAQISAAPLRGIEAPLPPRLSQHILSRTTRKPSAHVMLTPLASAPRAHKSRQKNRSFSFGSAPLWAAPALALWILMLGRADFNATLPVATTDSALDIPLAAPQIAASTKNKQGDGAAKRQIIAPVPLAASPLSSARAVVVPVAPTTDAATPTEPPANRGANEIVAHRAAPLNARSIAPVARSISVRTPTLVPTNNRAQNNLDGVFLLAINAGQSDVTRARRAPNIVSNPAPIAPIAPQSLDVAAPIAPAPGARTVKSASRPARVVRFNREDAASSRVALAALASPISPVRTWSSARLRSASFSEDAMRPRVSHLSANGRRLARLAPEDDAATLRVSRPIAQAPTLREVSFGNADNGPKLDELRSAVDDFRASVAGDE